MGQGFINIHVMINHPMDNDLESQHTQDKTTKKRKKGKHNTIIVSGSSHNLLVKGVKQ